MIFNIKLLIITNLVFCSNLLFEIYENFGWSKKYINKKLK